MTFQQLQYFLEVGHTGSVSTAAKNLIVSPSSISIAVGNLEKELGYPLLVRGQKGVRLTRQGKKAMDYADRICNTHKLLFDIGKEEKRRLRINSGDYLFVAKAFSRASMESEDVKFVMTGYETDELYQKMLQGELDLNLLMVSENVRSSWEKRLQKGGLQFEVLQTVPVAVKLSREHPLARKKSLTPQDLRDQVMTESPHKQHARGKLYGGLLQTDTARNLYVSGKNARDELIRSAMAYTTCVMPSIEQRRQSPFVFLPLEGGRYYFLSVTNPRNPFPPEGKRFLQILREELKLAYPETE